MLIGFLSDPHANLPALETVLEDVDRVRPDLLVCLGDFVGYGAHPNEVVGALRERCAVSLMGNHDLAALGEIDISLFNSAAAASARWTRNQLSRDTEAFLRPLSPRASIEGIELAHASIRDPVWEYVLDSRTAAASFADRPFESAFVGHTHVPATFWETDGRVSGQRLVTGASGSEEVELPEGRLLLNPGGVGQPRDGDPRASWAIWEPAARVLTLRRLDYPVELAQEAILGAGLPEVLAERLADGW